MRHQACLGLPIISCFSQAIIIIPPNKHLLLYRVAVFHYYAERLFFTSGAMLLRGICETSSFGGVKVARLAVVIVVIHAMPSPLSRLQHYCSCCQMADFADRRKEILA